MGVTITEGAKGVVFGDKIGKDKPKVMKELTEKVAGLHVRKTRIKIDITARMKGL